MIYVVNPNLSMKTILSDTFFMTKKYTQSLGKCNASPRSSKHKERLINDHVGFWCLSKRLEFTLTHPRTFSEATALWILVQVGYFGSKCGYIWCYLLNNFTSEQLNHLFS